MQNALQQKVFMVTPPAAISDNASPTTAEVDTLGFEHLTYVVIFGAMDIAVAALSLTQSDTTGSGHVAITGADFATGTNSAGSAATLPSATDDNHFYAFHVNLLGKKRFVDMTLTTGDGSAGTYVTVIAILSRAAIGTSSATLRGYTQEIFV